MPPSAPPPWWEAFARARRDWLSGSRSVEEEQAGRLYAGLINLGLPLLGPPWGSRSPDFSPRPLVAARTSAKQLLYAGFAESDMQHAMRQEILRLALASTVEAARE